MAAGNPKILFGVALKKTIVAVAVSSCQKGEGLPHVLKAPSMSNLEISAATVRQSHKRPNAAPFWLLATTACAVLGAAGGCNNSSNTMENATQQTDASTTPSTLDLAALPKIGTVDERFQSYNVEMAELTGGNFWKPYDQIGKPTPPPPADAPNQRSTPAGMDPKLYQYLPPST
ncbi:hypothetical protein [Hymenobacter radiodurans]|uniref:hypothetical protein n=1 Tax=Hymenobacter radiodurans TaxID=2496028 RepID=UPI001058860F|nr:hypothetical protein [Hymenobacter radiodurans]